MLCPQAGTSGASVLEPLNGPKPTTPPPYYDYTLRHNGSAIKFGSDKRDYLTDVLTSKAVALIHRYVPGPQPFFMIVDEIAPHSGPNRDPRCRGSALPARRDGDAFGDAVLPMPPSFNETDVNDKPRFIRIQPRMTAADIAEVRRRRNCRLASLKAVDLGVQRIVQALGEEHELWNTAIFYLSDNGFLLGEHRLFGKLNPYEESLRVPFTIRLPKRFLAPDGAPRQLQSVAANIDVAPTILDLAGTEPCNSAEACRVLDGRSLLPAIQSGGADWPATRGIALELSTSWKAHSGMPCKYQGIRTAGHLFVEYHSINLGEGCVPDNEVEDYDLRSDPFELHNRFPARLGTAAAKQQEALRSRTKKLSDCSGIRGRDPEPVSGHYCE
jgi:N-acetylglucosamine-6-sulfatase